jgi:hypothetical protein
MKYVRTSGEYSDAFSERATNTPVYLCQNTIKIRMHNCVGNEPPIAVCLLPVYLCLLVYPVYPVYYPSKRVYVYLLLHTTMVNVFTFTAKQVNCLLSLLKPRLLWRRSTRKNLYFYIEEYKRLKSKKTKLGLNCRHAMVKAQGGCLSIAYIESYPHSDTYEDSGWA